MCKGFDAKLASALRVDRDVLFTRWEGAHPGEGTGSITAEQQHDGPADGAMRPNPDGSLSIRIGSTDSLQTFLAGGFVVGRGGE
jgi:hypothetical protein